MYRERKKKFRDPKIRKKILWREITEGLLKANGYGDMTEEHANKKV